MPDLPPKLETNGQIARLTFARPAHKNRIEPADIQTLTEIFESVAADPAIRVLILTGEGDTFSAGFDLRALAAGDIGDPLSGPGGFAHMVDALENLPQPTIARLNGGAYGGATDLALACDFRVGTESFAAAMPAARIGLHYYKSGLIRYASRLGHNAAKRMFLTAERLNAGTLLQIGFLTHLVSAESLDETINTLAAAIAANAPLAVQGAKAALNALAQNTWSDATFTTRAQTALNSPDLQEGLAALTEKRPPNFQG